MYIKRINTLYINTFCCFLEHIEYTYYMMAFIKSISSMFEHIDGNIMYTVISTIQDILLDINIQIRL